MRLSPQPTVRSWRMQRLQRARASGKALRSKQTRELVRWSQKPSAARGRGVRFAARVLPLMTWGDVGSGEPETAPILPGGCVRSSETADEGACLRGMCAENDGRCSQTFFSPATVSTRSAHHVHMFSTASLPEPPPGQREQRPQPRTCSRRTAAQCWRACASTRSIRSPGCRRSAPGAGSGAAARHRRDRSRPCGARPTGSAARQPRMAGRTRARGPR
jgi:hypothetical protein